MSKSARNLASIAIILIFTGILLTAGYITRQPVSTLKAPGTVSEDAAENRPTTELPEGLVKWQTELGNHLAGLGGFTAEPGLVVSDGLVYVTTYPMNGDERNNPSPCLCVFDARTGEKKWSFEHNGTGASAPAVANGLVFLSVLKPSPIDPTNHDVSHVYALDAKTGKEEWSFQAGSREAAQPLVADGIVYVASLKERQWISDEKGQIITGGPNIYALRAGTGELLWKEPMAADTWTAAIIENGVLYYVEHLKYTAVGAPTFIRALELKTHTSKWIYTVPAAYGDVNKLLVGNGLVYFRYDGLPDAIYALDADKGTLAWHYDGDKELRGGMNPGSCCMFSPIRDQRNTRRHSFSLEASPVYTTYAPILPGLKTLPALAGDTLLIGIGLREGTPTSYNDYGDMEGYLLALDAQTGKERWRTHVQRVLGGWPVLIVHEETAYLMAYTASAPWGEAGPTSIYALNTKDGTMRWKLALGYELSAVTMTVYEDSIIAADWRGRLYALRMPSLDP